MKYTVKVSLCTIGINQINGEYNILSLESENLILPFIEMNESTTIVSILEKLSSLHIDLDSNWIHYSIVGAIIDNSCQDKIEGGIDNLQTLLLLYRCIIPLDTKLINASWIPSWKCINNPLTQIILSSL